MTPRSYSPRLTVVADVVDRAIRRWPDQSAAIERGASLLLRNAVAPLTPTSWGVRSSTDAGVIYAVTLDACTCPAGTNRPAVACKHRWACDLLVVATERQHRLDLADHAYHRTASRHDGEEQARRARVTADTVALAYARSVGFLGAK